MKYESVFEAKDIDEIKSKFVSKFLNELAYKGPKEFAIEFEKLTQVKLLEIPPYHGYSEFKATRDIHTHNNGISNEIYLTKAGTQARVRNNEYLPITVQYFLESYEHSLKLIEALEMELNKIWESPAYEKYKEELIANIGENATTQDEQIESVTKTLEEKNEAEKKGNGM